MNILLTSAGRRAYLVKYFKNAIGNKGKVYVGNSSEYSTAFQYADGTVITPLIYCSDYIPFLISFCKEKKISLIIPLFDIDLLVLAQNRERFNQAGIRLLVSNEKIIEICNDKWKTYQFLKKHDFGVPRTYLKLAEVVDEIEKKQLTYPVIVKPRFGCGSIGVSLAYDEKELDYVSQKCLRNIASSYLKYESEKEEEKLIYQEMIKGQEFGIDMINDLNGKFRNIIIKKKIAMRSGETDIAEIVTDSIVYTEMKRLCEITHHIANMDCDIFLWENKVYILDMNARFGGGYPFSHVAGCNLPEAIVKWCQNETVPDETLEAKEGIIAYKEITVMAKQQ